MAKVIIGKLRSKCKRLQEQRIYFNRRCIGEELGTGRTLVIILNGVTIFQLDVRCGFKVGSYFGSIGLGVVFIYRTNVLNELVKLGITEIGIYPCLYFTKSLLKTAVCGKGFICISRIEGRTTTDHALKIGQVTNLVNALAIIYKGKHVGIVEHIKTEIGQVYIMRQGIFQFRISVEKGIVIVHHIPSCKVGNIRKLGLHTVVQHNLLTFLQLDSSIKIRQQFEEIVGVTFSKL